MAETKTYSREDTLGLISAKAKTAEGYTFAVKVYRKKGTINNMGGIPEHACTLGGATLYHVANAEQWIHQLFGGGSYFMEVYGPDDPSRPIGGMLTYQLGGEATAFSPLAMRKHGWSGPTELHFPTLDQEQQQQAQSQIFVTNPGAVPQQMSHQQSQQVAGQIYMPQPQPDFALQQQFEQMRRDKEALERRLLDQEAMRREEALKRESDAKVNALERKLEMVLAKLDQPREAPPPQKSVVVEILPVLAPVLQQMMQAQAETQKLMMTFQMQASERQAAVQTEMIKAQSQRPVIPPEIQAMMDKMQAAIDRAREQDPTQHSMISQMADAMAGMTSMMVNTLTTISESGLGGSRTPDEPVALKVVKEIGKAIEAFASASVQSTRRPGQVRLPPTKPQRQLPPQQPAAAVATGPQQPTPAAEPAPQFAGAPENPLDEVEDLIREKADPALVADKLIAAAKESAVAQDELRQAGSFFAVFSSRIENTWAVANGPYLAELLDVVQAKAIEAGLMKPDDEEGGEGGEEEGVSGEVIDAEDVEDNDLPGQEA